MCVKAQHVPHWCQEYCPRRAGWESRTKIIYSQKNVLGFLSPSHLTEIPTCSACEAAGTVSATQETPETTRLSLGDNLREKPLYKIPYSVHSHPCKPSLRLHDLSLVLPSLPPGLFNPLPAVLVSDRWAGGLTLMDYPTCMHL